MKVNAMGCEYVYVPENRADSKAVVKSAVKPRLS